MRPRHPLLRQIARGLRILLGILLICGGLLGFLPILGFWMLPLGAIVLAKRGARHCAAARTDAASLAA